MQEALVFLSESTFLTTSLIIAKGTDNEHDSVMSLIRKYQSDLETFAPCRFQIDMVNRFQGGGKPLEYALLNERQATLLITYMRNNIIVRDFKIKLVKAFYDMAEGKQNANESREEKYTRLITECTQLIKEQKETITELTPKALAFECFTAEKKYISLQDAAKFTGWHRSTFVALLKGSKILQASGLPDQAYIDNGYFAVKTTTTEVATSKKAKAETMVTYQGMKWLADEHLSHMQARTQYLSGGASC